jgi:hypothetical protein
MNLASLLRAPPAALFLRPWFDAAAVPFLSRWYLPLSRAWAAALVAGGSPERFAAEVPCRPPPAWLTRRPLARAARLARAHEAARGRWSDAFFGPEPVPPELLAEAEAQRRRSAHALMSARADFAALHLQRPFPAVRWEVAGEAEVRRRHGRRLADPERAFSGPEPVPAVEHSRAYAAGLGDVSWVRVPTMVSARPDTAWARVDAPARSGPRASLVFSHGLNMEVEDWRGWAEPPAALAEAGLCAIRPEGPFHGRRRSAGRYGGEEVVGRGLIGLLDYFEAHVAELGLLIAWARSAFGGPVAVGGVSLGAMTAQLAAVAARGWPRAMRPDAVFLVATGASMAATALEGSLFRALGLPEALEAAGWTREGLEPWKALLEVRDPPAVAPDKIIVVLGLADDLTPLREGKALVKAWGVPESNVFLRSQGHFSASLGLLHDPAPIRRLAGLLAAG